MNTVSLRQLRRFAVSVLVCMAAGACSDSDSEREGESDVEEESSKELPTLSELPDPEDSPQSEDAEESASEEPTDSGESPEPDDDSDSPKDDDASPDASPKDDGSDSPKDEPDEKDEPESGKDDGPHEDICSEKVPAHLHVDNIPAYSQCPASLNAKIWSNNGVRTATSSKGDDWVPTQWGGGYQCTEFAKRYMYFRFGVEKFPNGNAGLWCDGVTPPDLEKAKVPVHGDLVVFGPGDCGASLATGHVAVVDKVDEAKRIVEFVEQNQANRRTCSFDATACFLHAKANKQPNPNPEP